CTSWSEETRNAGSLHCDVRRIPPAQPVARTSTAAGAAQVSWSDFKRIPPDRGMVRRTLGQARSGPSPGVTGAVPGLGTLVGERAGPQEGGIASRPRRVAGSAGAG